MLSSISLKLKGPPFFIVDSSQKAKLPSIISIVVNRQLAETLQIYHNWETPTVFISISWFIDVHQSVFNKKFSQKKLLVDLLISAVFRQKYITNLVN